MTETGSPCSFETRDEYGRRAIAEKVTKLLRSEVAVSPLIVNGDFGIGKTEFCRKLIALINAETQDLTPVYVDAFKADHANSPLMTLLAAVLEAVPESSGKKALRDVALPVLRFSAHTAGKAVASWVIKETLDNVSEGFRDVLEEAGNEAVNASMKSLLKDHEQIEERIDSLRACLKGLAERTQLVVFIDELDRCRPDFAVSMIEDVKHIFSVPNVQFVFVANIAQLRASINHRYGHSIDANRYLDKFIGFSLTLPSLFESRPYQLQQVSLRHFDRLVANSPYLQSSSIAINQRVSDFCHYLIRFKNLSLREVEKFVLTLEAMEVVAGQRLSRNWMWPYHACAVYSTYLVLHHADVADMISMGIVDVTAIAESLGKTAINAIPHKKRPDFPDIIVAGAALYPGSNISGYFEQLSAQQVDSWKSIFGQIGFDDDIRQTINAVRDEINALRLLKTTESNY